MLRFSTSVAFPIRK
ncbi:hypothetical protein FWK35_00002649 [Aphis craccivora]|uniref:Uncharacterized protein n=1 Tax=Aphis craccivora TaxID=307492 RepID=A0A6G0YWD0_APHCR|nr:hypothetical protein FWK35_00002649 [Aphis craccivora]